MDDLFEVLANLNTTILNSSKKDLYPELKKKLNKKIRKKRKRTISDIILEKEIYHIQYYKDKNSYIKAKKKEWYQKKNNRYVECECGSIIKIFGVKNHLKSHKHLTYEAINNKDKIAPKIKCECGSYVVKMQPHLQTQKHKLWASNLQNI